MADDFEIEREPGRQTAAPDDFEIERGPRVGSPPPSASGALDNAADIGKSLVSGAARAGSAVPGMLGSGIQAGEWAGDRLRTLWRNSGSGTQGPDGKTLTPEQVDAQVRAERAAKNAARGDTDEFTHVAGVPIPTSAYTMRKAQEAAPDIFGYKPTTGVGRVAQPVMETGAGIAVGLGGARSASTIGGGLVGTEAGKFIADHAPEWLLHAGDKAGVTPKEMKEKVLPAAGGVAGGLGAAVAPSAVKWGLGKTVESPEALYQEGLNAARRADADLTSKGRGQLSPDEALELRQQGVDVPSHMLMGPTERQFVAEAAAKDPKLRARVAAMNDEVNATAQSPHRQVGRFIDDSFGPNGVELQQAIPAIQEHVRRTNDANYTHVMDNLPHAQEVWSPAIERLYRTDIVAPYVREAAQQAGVRDSVSAPVWREAVEPQGARVSIGQGNQWTHTPEVPGQPAGFYPDPAAPTNLRFHDTVQRLMRDDMENAFKNGDTTRAKALQEAREKLLAETDSAVPEYPAMARDPAHDVFGQRDMLQAGTQYMRRTDQYKQSQVRQAFERATPEQQGLFQYGLAGELKSQYTAQPQATANKIMADRGKFEAVMGKPWVDQFLAQHKMAVAQHQAQGIPLPNIPPPKGWVDHAKTVGKAALAGGTPAAALTMAELAGYGVSPYIIAAAHHPLTLAAGAAASPFVATHVIRNSIRNGRQKQANALAVDNATRTLPGFDPNVPMIQRKAGGEVGPKPRGKINVDSEASALVAMVDQARASISGATQNILQQPDTNVVQALSVAKKALG